MSFPHMHRRYVIWSPPYRHNSGGIRALTALRDELRRRGRLADLHYELTRDDPFDPVADIVVYPEIVASNPLGGRHVVRWLLNKATLPDDGLIFEWVDGMDPRAAGRLTVDAIEADVFYADSSQPHVDGRVLLWEHKGTVDPRLVPPGAVPITYAWPATRTALADQLRSADYLLTFDPFTMLTLEAQLCHTPVLLYPTGQWTRAEVEAGGWPLQGVAWDVDELPAARARVHEACIAYRHLRERMSLTIDLFQLVVEAAFR